MVEQANVVEAFRRYAYNNITLQDTSTFGTRPQDTNELTFKEPEIREVMVMAMLCKLASPVFGELINNLPEELDVESGKRRLPKYKESRCSGFLNAVLGKYFTTPIDSDGRTLLDKLQGYILHIVKGLCSKHQDPAAIFHGLTEYTRTSIIMSAMLVRNYVLCQLEKNESNIIKYTDTLVRTLAQTQDTNAHKAQIRTRKAPGSMSNDESGNIYFNGDGILLNANSKASELLACDIDKMAKEQVHVNDLFHTTFTSLQEADGYCGTMTVDSRTVVFKMKAVFNNEKELIGLFVFCV
jgi:hypothetical protein